MAFCLPASDGRRQALGGLIAGFADLQSSRGSDAPNRATNAERDGSRVDVWSEIYADPDPVSQLDSDEHQLNPKA